MIAIYDNLAKVLYDEERNREYSPLSCMNDATLTARGGAEGAVPCIYAINASQKLNSEIAFLFRRALSERRIDLLIPFNNAQEDIFPKIKEYISAPDAETQFFYEKPFLETQELIAESCSLLYEKKQQTGAIVIYEQGSNRKDRYTSVSYLVYFCDELGRDLLEQGDDYEYSVFIN